MEIHIIQTFEFLKNNKSPHTNEEGSHPLQKK